jgi:sigma-E factor negative regulatory protein RseB
VTGTRRPAGVALVAVATLALAWPVGAWAAGSGESDDSQVAARLVTRTRDASSRYDFSGRATVTWSTGSGTRRAPVQVHDAAGSIEVVSATGVVVDQGRHTYLRDPRTAPRWTSVLVEPSARGVPAPGSHWQLSTEGGRTVARRPTTVVMASRPDGTPAQRLFVDDATGLVLGREVLGPNGRVERSLTFDDIAIGTAGTVETPKVGTAQALPLSSLPTGYRAPASTAGYRLVTRSRHPDGVLLFYSDGLFAMSVFEQHGQLNWSALPQGGTTGDLGGTNTRAYREPSGNVLVWERDGVVYTCVSDAPSDVFTEVVDGFAGAGRSTPESVVDFVLGPFGWG